MITLFCEVCSKPFKVYGHRSNARFCSMACKGLASRAAPNLTCLQCGCLFHRSVSVIGAGYCSRKCSDAARSLSQKRDCEQCGKSFDAKVNQHGLARFCSIACQSAWQGRNKIELACVTCGTAFFVSKSVAEDRGRQYCSMKCRNADPAFSQRLRRMNADQQTAKPNRLELLGYSILDDIGIKYLPQHMIGNKFCVDAFIPARNLVVQFDGDYWHGNPAKYDKPNAVQQKRINHDRAHDAYMSACGIKVIRFWESEIKAAPSPSALFITRLNAV